MGGISSFVQAPVWAAPRGPRSVVVAMETDAAAAVSRFSPIWDMQLKVSCLSLLHSVLLGSHQYSLREQERKVFLYSQDETKIASLSQNPGYFSFSSIGLYYSTDPEHVYSRVLQMAQMQCKNRETKEMEKFTHLEALLFTAVLENCVEQLSILEHTMLVSYEGKTELCHSWVENLLRARNTPEKEYISRTAGVVLQTHRLRLIDLLKTGSQELKETIETQKELDMNSQEFMTARPASGETLTSTPLKSTEHKQQLGKTEDLKSARHLPRRAVKHSALSVENLVKIQADRQYASDVITATMKKMQESGTFNSLTEANEREKAKKSKFHDVLIRDEELKTEIKALEKQLQDVKKETETELQNRDDTILCLKDQLREVKAKTNMEICYMKKSTDLQVHQTQKKCSNAEKVLENKIQELKNKIDKEIRVHVEIEHFLRQRYQKVEEKLEHWVDKYENDTDAKDEELNALSAAKAKSLAELRSLATECQRIENIIISDRAEKDAKRRQVERDALELKSALKVQSWWRGTMVRRYLGPYQALAKLRQQQLPSEKGKEKSGAKKKAR